MDGEVGPFLRRIVERLLDQPVMVFSRSGEVLFQTRSAEALFGEHPPGDLELHHQLLVDPVDHQVLVVFTAEPGSPGDDQLRRWATGHD